MAVRLVVTITAAQGKGAELAQVMKARCAEAQKEPGCEQFEVFQSVANPDRLARLERWADQAALDVHAKLNAIPFANFIPKILNFDSSMYMLGWGVATFDGLYTLQSLVRTKTTGADGSFNLGRVSDPKLDTTIDAIKIATDPKARDALLREGLLTTRDQAYYIPLHHQMRPWAMKKSVTISYSPDDRPQARFATLK